MTLTTPTLIRAKHLTLAPLASTMNEIRMWLDNEKIEPMKFKWLFRVRASDLKSASKASKTRSVSSDSSPRWWRRGRSEPPRRSDAADRSATAVNPSIPQVETHLRHWKRERRANGPPLRLLQSPEVFADQDCAVRAFDAQENTIAFDIERLPNCGLERGVRSIALGPICVPIDHSPDRHSGVSFDLPLVDDISRFLSVKCKVILRGVGRGGQSIRVVPELDLVVVVTAGYYQDYSQQAFQVQSGIFRDVLRAISIR
jgi:hypothetical protein